MEIERCEGIGSDADGWHEECESCARLATRKPSDQREWVEAPVIIVFCCEYWIGK